MPPHFQDSGRCSFVTRFLNFNSYPLNNGAARLLSTDKLVRSPLTLVHESACRLFKSLAWSWLFSKTTRAMPSICLAAVSASTVQSASRRCFPLPPCTAHECVLENWRGWLPRLPRCRRVPRRRRTKSLPSPSSHARLPASGELDRWRQNARPNSSSSFGGAQVDFLMAPAVFVWRRLTFSQVCGEARWPSPEHGPSCSTRWLSSPKRMCTFGLTRMGELSTKPYSAEDSAQAYESVEGKTVALHLAPRA